MLADKADVVVGVDTHRDQHYLVALDARGALLGERQITANRAGYAAALAWARSLGETQVFAIEGAGAYGAGLCRHLVAGGERVLEVERPGRPSGRRRRRSGKDDRQDALAAAREVLSGAALASPRIGAAREALRVLLVVREGAVGARAASLNQLRAPSDGPGAASRAPGGPHRATPARCLPGASPARRRRCGLFRDGGGPRGAGAADP
jgi:transposase